MPGTLMRMRYLLVATLIGLAIAAVADAAVTRTRFIVQAATLRDATQDIARVGAKPERNRNELPIHQRLESLRVNRLLLIPSNGLQLLPLHAAWRMTADGQRRAAPATVHRRVEGPG